MTKYYAIARGKVTGIYNNWIEAKKQIDGYKNPKFKLFDNEKDAQDFIKCNSGKTQILDKFITIEDPKEDDNNLIVFTDGSARGNGKKHAVAGYAVVWPYHTEMNHSARLSDNELHTNNRAEYNAVLSAIKQADEIDSLCTKTLIVYTDSMLLINSLTNWIHKWKINNWRKSDGEIISNLDLVQELDINMKKRKVAFRHVMAHTGKQTWEAKYNDIVDKMAQQITL